MFTAIYEIFILLCFFSFLVLLLDGSLNYFTDALFQKPIQIVYG